MSKDALMVNLSDLMGKALRDAAEPKREPEPELAVQLLRDAFAKLSERHEFQPGDLLQKKRGLEEGTKDWRGGVGMFVRYATDLEPAKDDGICVARYELDCVVAVLTSTSALIEFTACSRYLEPYTGGNADA